MTILFYRYDSICEPDIINAFQNMQLHVVEITAEMTDKSLSPSACVSLVSHAIEEHHPVFVFSINFFPAIAEVCHIYKLLYLCWTVDSPVPELFSKSILHSTNRIFLFDKAQYDYFAPYNADCMFHLPLAAASVRFDHVIRNITAADIRTYSNDISFVGSLYIEKNPLHAVSAKLSEYSLGYINGIVDSALKIYGYNLIEELINDDIVEDLKKNDSAFYCPENSICDSSRYIAAHCYLAMEAAEQERMRTLNALAENFNVHLYTRSNTSSLHNIHVHDGVNTLTEMPKVFHLSKINLNMTIRSIQTGLPLRIFDILGCGGFVMTNYQPELDEYFDIGVDLEAYGSMEELIDKCAYYLFHEDVRKKIAERGYQKASQNHTYQQRLLEMLQSALA